MSTVNLLVAGNHTEAQVWCHANGADIRDYAVVTSEVDVMRRVRGALVDEVVWIGSNDRWLNGECAAVIEMRQRLGRLALAEQRSRR